MKQRGLKYRLLALCLVLSLVLPLIPAQALAAETDTIDKVYCTATLEDSFSDNEVLIIVMPEYNEEIYVISDFHDVGCTALEELSYDTEPGVLGRIFLLTLDEHSKQNVLDAVAILEQREDIYSAEPNYFIEVEEYPDDDYYQIGYQWGIDKINLPAAWDIESSANSVYVGVIDSGIDATHEDFCFNINTTLSKNFLRDGTSALTDSVGHGTKVASIIGADGNNDLGIVGVCWNVTLVSLKAASRATQLDGTVVAKFSEANVVSAIEYAEEKGIQILNFSAGSYTNALTSVKAAIQDYSGLFVCSAGNYGLNTDSNAHYPSYYNTYSNVISVGASTSSDTRWVSTTTADSSNYGKTTVDLFAPGANIYVCTAGGGYASVSGTSFAAPHVAGVAALILAIYPTLTASQLKTRILNNVDSVSAFSNLCVSGGRLNAYKALVG